MSEKIDRFELLPNYGYLIIQPSFQGKSTPMEVPQDRINEDDEWVRDYLKALEDLK